MNLRTIFLASLIATAPAYAQAASDGTGETAGESRPTAAANHELL